MKQKKPERIFWLVILGAFAAFLLLCAAVPVGARSYLLYSWTPKEATLEVIAGTVRVQERDATAPTAVTKSIIIHEGSAIETDENSKAILTLFDGSTITLFTGTQVTVPDMRVSMFEWGRVPITLRVDQTRGRIRVSPAPLYSVSDAAPYTRKFLVHTPHLSADLDEGSYAIDVYPDLKSQVTATNGNVVVTAQGKDVTLGRSQRTVVTRGNSPLAPLPAAQDFIVNGDFMDPPDVGWNTLPSQLGVLPGEAGIFPLGDRRTVRIIRAGSSTPTGQSSTITGIIQTINKDVSDFRTIKLTADIRLHNQSLSGGGILSSEYPLILRLKYRDKYGSEAEWVHGFYYQNTTNNPTVNGELVPVDVWVPFESGNLFEIADPTPLYITTLQIYASGWDYESYVSNIRLIVE